MQLREGQFESFLPHDNEYTHAKEKRDYLNYFNHMIMSILMQIRERLFESFLPHNNEYTHAKQ